MPRKRIKPRGRVTRQPIHKIELTAQQRKAIAECGLPPQARAAVETLALQMLLDARRNVPKKSETKAAMKKLLPKVRAAHAEICAVNEWDLDYIDIGNAKLLTPHPTVFGNASGVGRITERVKNDLGSMLEAIGEVLKLFNDPKLEVDDEPDVALCLQLIFKAFDLKFSQSKDRPQAVTTLHCLLNFVGRSSMSVAKNMVRKAMKNPRTEYGGVFVGPMMQRILAR
jgi:hypothetical protein